MTNRRERLDTSAQKKNNNTILSPEPPSRTGLFLAFHDSIRDPSARGSGVKLPAYKQAGEEIPVLSLPTITVAVQHYERSL